jgi:hypothetical protein
MIIARMTGSVKTKLLDGLLDDASQFPPGNLPLDEAWDAHRRWRRDPHAALVGRFLIPSARLPALAALVDPTDELGIEVGIVVGASDLIAGIPLPVTAVEFRGTAEEVDRWRAIAPDAVIFVEGAPVEALARQRANDRSIAAKLRCGGLEAAAFPSVETVASFVAACVSLEVPFKATAGLHGALRHWDPEIGVFHHGFLNLWAACALARSGADVGELARCLEVEETDKLGVSTEMLADARGLFLGFGTCSISEPLDGLRAVGLLDA